MYRLPISTLGLTAALALLCAAPALAQPEPVPPASSETTTPTPGPASPASPQPQPPASTPPATAPTASSTTPAPSVAAPAPAPAPLISRQRAQPRSALPAHDRTSTSQKGRPATTSASHGPVQAPPVAPGSLTPGLPPTLAGSLAGVPSFFINTFSIPPFLLPIYQAAGAAYGIPWQVLAAINEVETDYGRDLSVSSAGAEGWMQFLPIEWGRYGVDVNNDGFSDPYNPADAIFAAARYLKDAGGGHDIRAAVFAYNHSTAYVQSVMLRARLLGGTPPALLGAVTGLTEARFPVHAPAHFADGFPAGPDGRQLVGTAIYSQPSAPVIAVQDGRIVGLGRSPTLGHYVALRDAYGNTYTYAQLGALSTVYPVLEAASRHAGGTVAGGATTTAPSASAATVLGATPGPRPGPVTRSFRSGSHTVYLLPLHVGAHVIAGTVLGHLDAGAQAHIVFQIRPVGASAPLIDPKPILDGWVKLQVSSAIHVPAASAHALPRVSPGQALLAAKGQLERIVTHDRAVRLPACELRLIGDGRVDRRVLAVIQFLAASGLAPTVTPASCSQPSSGVPGHTPAGQAQALDISAIDGAPVASEHRSTPSAAAAVRRLLGLSGTMRPASIAGPAGLPRATSLALGPAGHLGGSSDTLRIAFAPSAITARASQIFTGELSPAQWLRLVARLGEIPNPQVPTQPSPAAIPAHTGLSTPSQAGA